MKRIQAMRPDKKFQIDPQKRNTSKTHESTPQQRKERQQQRPNKQGEKRKIKPKTNLSFPTKNNLKSQIRCYHDPKASQNNLHTQSSPKKKQRRSTSDNQNISQQYPWFLKSIIKRTISNQAESFCLQKGGKPIMGLKLLTVFGFQYRSPGS